MKQKLLLVDDRPENILVLESTLEDDSLEFVKANSGEAALRQLHRNDISLILLDVQMPDMDGFETAELIRGNPTTKHIPIIFVSAISKEQEHIFKGYASGAIDYIFKPFDPDILRSKVKVLLELDKHHRIISNQNAELNSAKRNTDSIMQNVKEGLFLVNKELKISPQYSSALLQILEVKDLADANVLDVLKGKISTKAFANCAEFLDLCYDPSVDTSVLEDVNPLSEIEYYPNGDNEVIKYLIFDCRRIYDGEEIENLIFTVTDNTQKVLLEKKLARFEEESTRQMDILLSILHVDPKLLRDFIDSLERDIEESCKLIAQLPKADKQAEMLEVLHRHLHQIKGNAAILDLKQFMEQAHSGEEIVVSLQEKKKLNEGDLKPISECMESIQAGIGEINQLLSKLVHIYKYFRPKRSYEVELLLRAIKNLVENLQESTGKKVELIYNNFDGVSIPYNCRLDLKDILVQLTRNSFYHGIETPQERKKTKKDPVGKITIETFKTEQGIGFTFRDDGRGIQIDKLKNAAKRSGKWTDTAIDQWDKDQIMNSIFTSGVTTMTKALTGAGRGVGMDIIKQMVNKLGGSITIASEPGAFTEFKIYFQSS
jgi:two-component system chemotaxis sensor kinase CheA